MVACRSSGVAGDWCRQSKALQTCQGGPRSAQPRGSTMMAWISPTWWASVVSRNTGGSGFSP